MSFTERLAGTALAFCLAFGPAARAAETRASKKAPKATAQPAPASLPPLLREVEDKYARAATLTAEFKQVNESAVMKQKKTSSGQIFFKRPDKIRWETTRPDHSLLVSDGKRFWFYTPPFDESENGQVIERRSSDVKSKLANDLLSATFSAATKANQMTIVQKSPSAFLLTPKKGSAGTVRNARIEIDPEKKLILKVELTHQDGNTSVITLDKIQLGKDLGDDIFYFDPPPRTDVVRE